jgi:hypothetical protein
LDRKHSVSVSRTVKIMSELNRTDMAGEKHEENPSRKYYYFERLFFH